MQLSLLNKYENVSIDELYLDPEFKILIHTLIEMDSLNILFVGACGTGKTTLIKTIIKEYYKDINGEPDIMEINNLKDQGISFYRTEVKTFCQTKSSIPGRRKVIMLDDFDLINEQSQQVFRICIDKYSKNVHFIASCTNPQKIIDNLQSRMTIIKINPLDIDVLNDIIKRICKEEEIKLASSEVSDFLIDITNQSIRPIINYLEKFKLMDQTIDIDMAHELCTNISFRELRKYTTLCRKGELKEAICLLHEFFNKGYSVMDILDHYFTFIKLTDLLSEQEKYATIEFICKYIAAFYNIHEDEIELALFTNNLISVLAH